MCGGIIGPSPGFRKNLSPKLVVMLLNSFGFGDLCNVAFGFNAVVIWRHILNIARVIVVAYCVRYNMLNMRSPGKQLYNLSWR